MNNKKVRIKDIAAKAGVSAGTVDRVLHNRGEVNEETKTKILELLKESGYQPNLIARALTSKKEYTIAVLIPKKNDDNVFWEMPLQGIIKAENEIKPYNFNVVNFLFEQSDEAEYAEQVQKIIELNPQGVVITPVFINETKHLTAKLNQAKIPYIFINTDMQSEKRICFIGQDSYTGGYVAAKLLENGLKKKGTILIINNTKNTENLNHFLERNKGFISYFNEHNTDQNFSLLTKNIFTDFENEIQQIFSEHTDIIGIYVSGSKSYLTAKYLEKINRKDILLIGYDLMDENIKYLKSGYINFIISQRSRDQGYLSIIQLFNYIAKGERINEDILMPLDILIKENYKYFLERKF